MSDGTVNIDTAKIRSGAAALQQVVQALAQIRAQLQAVPDPKVAAGTGADDLSQAFRASWANMQGDQLMQLVDSSSGKQIDQVLNQLAEDMLTAAKGFEDGDSSAGDIATELFQAVAAQEGQSQPSSTPPPSTDTPPQAGGTSTPAGTVAQGVSPGIPTSTLPAIPGTPPQAGGTSTPAGGGS
jgi:hypothetical protein